MIIKDETKLLMIGNGASPEGDLPFLDEFDLISKTSKRLWRCEAPYYERVISMISQDGKTFITNRESKD